MNYDAKLISYGLKEAMVNKLSTTVKIDLISYAISNHSAKNLDKSLAILASLELNGKEGVAFLAANGVATYTQIKNLNDAQLKLVVDEYRSEEDVDLCRKMITDMIIENQHNNFQYDKAYMHNNEREDFRRI